MKDVNGLATCDATIAPDWHGCRARAKVAIETRYCELHYCRRHAYHADDRTGLYFQAKPFATPRALT